MEGHSLRPQRALTHSNILYTDIYSIICITAIYGYRLNCGGLAGNGQTDPVPALPQQPVVAKFPETSLRQYFSALRPAPLSLFQRSNWLFTVSHIFEAQTQLVFGDIATHSDVAVEIVQFDDFSFNIGDFFEVPAHGTPTIALRSIQGLRGASPHTPSSSRQSGQGHS